MSKNTYIIAGTIAVVIAFGQVETHQLTTAADTAYVRPCPVHPGHAADSNRGDIRPANHGDTVSSAPADLLSLLGFPSEGALNEALLAGKSLADLCLERAVPLRALVELQTAELREQLMARHAAGLLATTAFEAQLEELPELIEHSVYSRM